MIRRLLPCAGLALIAALASLSAAAPAPEPWKPAKPLPPAPKKAEPFRWHGKIVPVIDGVPDTGQFLPDTAVIGHVNDRVFHVHDFREGWFSSYAEVRPKPDSAGRVEFLRSMANKEVMALTALELGRPLEFEDRATMREHTERVLSNIAFQRLVADSVHIADSEVRHLYDLTSFVLHLQHIQFDDRATAERVHDDLEAKRITWSAAVKRYTTAKDDKGPNGELGWMIHQGLDPSVVVEVYESKPLQISRVFQDATGFQIVRVLEKKPAKQQPYDMVRNVLIGELQPARMADRIERLRDVLRNKIGMVYDKANITWASSLFGETAPVRRDESGETHIDISGDVPEFQQADTARTLATWKDGRLSLGEFLDDYKAIPVPQRMNVDSYDAFKNALDGFVLEPYMAQLAVERGLDKDPLAVAMINRKREELMVEHLFADSIESKVFVSDAERRAYYQKHLPDFFSFENVRYATILRPSKAGADSVAAELRAGKTAEAILRADSLGGRKQTGAIHERREDEKGAYYKLLFEEMKPGDVVIGPPDKEGIYVVFQLLQHDPGHQLKLEEVESIIDESLQNQKAEALLNAFIARHEHNFKIELHPELLMRVRLTDPVLD
jgi:parvulin-like peptidyl-prolyl cis-trans isomerase-like protein